MGNKEQGDRFFGREWPEAPAVEDPDLVLNEGFARRRRRVVELLSPVYLVAAVRSVIRAGSGKPVGDVLRDPGAFLVRDGEVLWSHDFRHFGDHPSPEALLVQVGNIR